MFKKNTHYLLFGNPISHSKSPIIYRLFSKLTNFSFNYSTYFVELDEFEKIVLDFFSSVGEGANVTVPFKEQAYNLSNILTKRARVSGAVNVLKKINNNKILGDNTDGIGFLYDLKRLNFIKTKMKILLIGAGGAAKGIIPILLSLQCVIHVVNRTLSRAKKIVSLFQKLGDIHAIDVLLLKELKYDLVINAAFLNQDIQQNFFISNIIFYPAQTCFYDLSYSNEITPFLSWCKDNGAIYYSDGIGMLVSQAAYSFYLWHGIFPDIETTIHILNNQK